MGLGSGIHRALEAWPHIQLENHERGNEFKAVIARTYMAEETGQVTGQVSHEVNSLLSILNGEMNRADIMQELGLVGRDNFRKLYLVPALEAGFIEMTIPEKTNSRLQAYRLTQLGHSLAPNSRNKSVE